MYCPSCGAQINDHADNCNACGAPQGIAPPPPQYNDNAYGRGHPVATYLAPSILVTIFCCQIFGIVAIVYSAIAMGKNSSGDYAGAQQSANSAKMWCWLGFGIGLVIILIYAGLMLVGGLAGAAGSNP